MIDSCTEGKLEARSRESFEAPVREFEDRVLGYATLPVTEPKRAEHIVEQAFAVALTGTGSGSLEARLCAAVRKLAGRKAGAPAIEVLPPTELRVSRELHLRILDAVEDRQYTAQPGRSRLAVAGVLLFLLAVAGLAQFGRARAEALAASAPVVTSITPFAGETEVSLDGQFLVQFARMPAGTPTLTHLPPDGKQSAARWDGTNLVADYAGLRLGVRYQVILEGSYRSRTHDTGHFEQRWSFSAHGPPRLAHTVPAEGAAMVPRYGMMYVDFTRQPASDPVLTLHPPATLSAGSWSGNTWTVRYAGLQPLTRYAADLTVPSGDPTGRIHRAWAFTSEVGAPPDGVPVVWYSTSSPWQPASGASARLVAVDWTGAMVGTLYANAFGRQNPQGSWLSMFDGSGAVDSQGRVLTEPLFAGAIWSDVGSRFCNIGFDPTKSNALNPQWLETGSVGGGRRRVATLGTVQSGQGGFTILACSTLSDRAVVGTQTQAGFLEVRVIALSTGRRLYSHSYLNAPQMLIGSRDGRYVAESANGTGPSATVIHRLSDGAIVARLRDRRVVAFSWDGSQVVTAPSWGQQTPGEVQLLDWRSGTVLWRAAGNPAATGELPVYALAQPNGTAFMIGIGNPTGSGDADGLLLVHSDGRSEKVVGGPVFPAGYSG